MERRPSISERLRARQQERERLLADGLVAEYHTHDGTLLYRIRAGGDGQRRIAASIEPGPGGLWPPTEALEAAMRSAAAHAQA